MAEYNGAQVEVYYVDGENGNDGGGSPTHDGTSVALAWKTIQYAFEQIELFGGNDGNDVRIIQTSDDSTYYDLGGAHQTTGELIAEWASKEVIINGANPSGVVDGTIVEIYGTSLGGTDSMINVPALHDDLDHTTFSHLKFNAANTAQYCVEFEYKNNISVNWVNCQFTGATSHGYYTSNQANYHSFINCRFDNNGGSGLEQQSTSFSLIHKCLFDNNTGDGARVGSSSRITDSIFYNNGDDGLFVNNSGAIVCNCIFDSNGSDGLYSSGTFQGIYINNLYTNNTSKGLNASAANNEHRQFNPAFYNNTGGDYSTPASNDHLSLYEYLTSATVTYDDAANFDFTPDSASPILEAGVPTPFQRFGSTTSDIGLNKFRAEGGENISIF
tara:strand:+ start:168 stop:1325 length:1158 start_codon:yes stop_codon:yes gene_type:complete